MTKPAQREIERPNPGSDEARKLGCKCPVLDNARGKGIGLTGDCFWITETCPLHGSREDKT